jgi:hypothetical protein
MECEVPDADAQEQAQEVTAPSTTSTPRPETRDAEAPEADALEQSQEVPVDEDDEARG